MSNAPTRVSDRDLYTPYVKAADLSGIPYVIVGYHERENEYKGKKNMQSVFIVVPVSGADRGQELQLTIQKNHNRAKLGARALKGSVGPFLLEKMTTDKRGQPIDPPYWAMKDAGDDAATKARLLFEKLADLDGTVPDEDDLPF